MANDIKNLLDDIINNTDNSLPSEKTDDNSTCEMFDKESFREKLSMFVLKDIICAMMHRETKDLDEMIDNSIMRHIKDDYKGTCYGYLCKSRDALNSPLVGDIIQEIDDKTEEAAEESSRTKNKVNADEVDIRELLKNVENYDEFDKMITDTTSERVIKEVSDLYTKSNQPPTFDGLDKKIKVVSGNQSDVTTESAILKMCGTIVSEAAISGNPISVEQGLEQAIIEFCINDMDYLFKQKPAVSIYQRFIG